MLVVLLSLYVLFAPDPGGPSRTPAGTDKVVHAVLFALLAATARWRCGPGASVLLAVLLYAPLSEAVQAGVLPSRSGDLLDVVADVAGAGGGWVLAGRLLRRAPRH